MNFQCVMFDLDGTILDTHDVIVASFYYTVEKFTGKKPGPRDVERLFGLTLLDQMRRYCPDKAEEMVKAYVEHNLRGHSRLAKPFPGAKEVLEGLKEKGCRLAVVTSKGRKSAIYGLDLFGLKRYFDTLVCAEDVTLPKPNPEPVLMAAEAVGIPADSALVVGDSVYDVMSGKAAGALTAACLYGMGKRAHLEAARPDFLISDIREVLELVQVSRPALGRGSST